MKLKDLIVLFVIIYVLFFYIFVPFAKAEDSGYSYSTVINGNNSTTTYTDRHTNKTYGERNSISGNTTKNDSAEWDTTNRTNGNITTHTYTNKKTGEVTGGSTWRNGNTTRSYGTYLPHPYKTE